MKKAIGCTGLVFLLLSCAAFGVEPLYTEREYKYIPANIAYAEDQSLMTISWNNTEYQILEASIFNGRAQLGGVVPGAAFGLNRTILSSQPLRVRGRARVVSTGAMINFITPVWDPECPLQLPVDFFGCQGRFLENLPMACQISVSTTCPDGTTIELTCEGDGADCTATEEEGSSISCGATKKTIQKVVGEKMRPDGSIAKYDMLEITSTDRVEKKKNCPPVFPPNPPTP